MCFAPQRRALFRHLNCQKWSKNGVFCAFSLRNVLRPTMACIFSTSEPPKVVRTWCVCTCLYNFVHFDFEMCFALQRRALFRHLNFQKWSEPLVFLTFWLRHVLRATTACTFLTSQLPKVVRTPGVFNILTWKCASRHNGVHFFDISTTKSGPELVCFVHFDLEICFAPQRRAIFHLSSGQMAAPAALASLLLDPPEPQIIGKAQCFATFLPFRAPASSCFWLFLFSDLPSSDSFSSLILSLLTLSLLTLSLLWSSLFYSSLLSDSSHHCFSSVHIGGSLTSKLPSMIQSRKRTKAWHRRKWTRLEMHARVT